MVLGYTTGVYDLFHIGHVNLLRSAKALCDRLIVGVTVDELVAYKHKKAVIPFSERLEVVRSCRFVDLAIPQTNIDKFQAWKKLKFNVLVVGDDWHEAGIWPDLERNLKNVGVDVRYIPYTQGTSSTLINDTLKKLRNV